jgi:hypothetical protein
MKAPGQNSTIEPTAVANNVTNEPTIAGENATNEPIMICNWLNCDTVAIVMIGVGVRKTHIPELLAGQISAA